MHKALKYRKKKFNYPFRKLKWESIAVVIRSVNTSAFSALGPKNHVPTAAQGFATSSSMARLEKIWRLWVNMHAFPLRASFFPFRLHFLRGVNIVIQCLCNSKDPKIKQNEINYRKSSVKHPSTSLLRWTSIHPGGSRNTPSRFMLRKPG